MRFIMHSVLCSIALVACIGMVIRAPIPPSSNQPTINLFANLGKQAAKDVTPVSFTPEPTVKAQKTIRLNTRAFQKPNLQYCSVLTCVGGEDPLGLIV